MWGIGGGIGDGVLGFWGWAAKRTWLPEEVEVEDEEMGEDEVLGRGVGEKDDDVKELMAWSRSARAASLSTSSSFFLAFLSLLALLPYLNLFLSLDLSKL